MSLSAWMADVLGSYFSGVNHTVVDRLLLLLEQILEDELAPSAAARVHQRATLVERSQLDGCEPELFGQGRHGSGRVLVVARQKNDPVAALDDRIGSQGGRNKVIETFHEFGAGERLRDEGGGRETVQFFRENSKMTLQRSPLPSSCRPTKRTHPKPTSWRQAGLRRCLRWACLHPLGRPI